MKIEEIEHVKPEDFAVIEDGTVYGYVVDRGCKDGAVIVDEYPKLYTEESMMKFMQENVDRALLMYGMTFDSKDGMAENRRLTKEERNMVIEDFFS
ncbi:MAG: hypothetical protein L0L52_05225 [Staphylococcus equorum]|nr:hypothetical protein [Lactococcus lactis]MDN6160539.1 hypothetical protein [Staphylococcus equorum]MDN6120308.1 hypothetical protein [Lactococcus lactis]MDN6505449.1 hypothetical protein [Lactococcus lactis]MDN6569875.1 hypothetical protein [Staphylococcus equorum]